MMEKVTLWVRYQDNLFPAGFTVMPKWVPGKEPKAVHWGTRFFLWDKDEKKYIEDFCYWATSVLDENGNMIN